MRGMRKVRRIDNLYDVVTHLLYWVLSDLGIKSVMRVSIRRIENYVGKR